MGYLMPKFELFLMLGYNHNYIFYVLLHILY